MEQALTAAEVGKMLGRTEGSMRQMTFRRELPFRKLGRRVVYLESEIRQMLQEAPGVRPDEIEPRERL